MMTTMRTMGTMMRMLRYRSQAVNVMYICVDDEEEVDKSAHIKSTSLPHFHVQKHVTGIFMSVEMRNTVKR
jgi:hypothetical protein